MKTKIDPDEIIEGMQDLEDLKIYFRDHHDYGYITLKDFSYILIKLDEITQYLNKKSGFYTKYSRPDPDREL